MRKIFTLALITMTMIFATETTAQDFSGLDRSPLDAATFPSSYKVADKLIKITYGRPQLKGRALSTLAKTGEVWRTGANESAEITFYKNVNFGGENIKAGTYSLFTIPGAKEWTIILNSKLNQWGAYSYDEKADITRITAPVTTGDKSIEAFSILFKEAKGGSEMILAWDKTLVNVPISAGM